MIVSKKELCTILEINDQTITAREKEGLPCKVRGGRGVSSQYSTGDVIKWLLRQERSKYATDKDTAKAVDLNTEQARLTKEKADAQELKNRIERKEVAPVSLMTTSIAKVSASAVAILASLKLSIKRKLPHLKNTELDIIEKEIARARNSIADMELVFNDD